MKTASIVRIGLGISCAVGAMNGGCAYQSELDWSGAQIDEHNDPTIAFPDLEWRWEQLPLSGASIKEPWPGDYWAAMNDSINYRWDGGSDLTELDACYETCYQTCDPCSAGCNIDDGQCFDDCFEDCSEPCYWSCEAEQDTREAEQSGDVDPTVLSPAEKYALAFNSPDVPALVSARIGLNSPHATTGWAGICNGWTKAALLERQPRQAVVHNGVVFYPGDLEALASYFYAANTPVHTVARSCNTDSAYDPFDPDDNDMVLSERPECRDVNPGTLHLMLANALGLRDLGFAMDASSGNEVWTQPIRAYQVTNHREIYDPVEAAQLIDPDATAYTYNEKATRFIEVAVQVDYVVESPPARIAHDVNDYTANALYEYVLELDDDGRILGGEYIGWSQLDHPDFMWVPVNTFFSDEKDGIHYRHLRKLLDKSAPAGTQQGDGCILNSQCSGGLVCRPTSSGLFANKACQPLGAEEYMADSGMCGGFCDFQADCQYGTRCVRWGAFQAGMCIDPDNALAAREDCL